MVWKCPLCSYTSTKYTTMMRHYYSHPSVKKKAKGKSVSKGKQSKKYTFHPPKKTRRK